MSANYIYWADGRTGAAGANTDGGVHRIKPDGTGSQNIVTSGIGSHSIRGLAVDWIAGKCLSTITLNPKNIVTII